MAKDDKKDAPLPTHVLVCTRSPKKTFRRAHCAFTDAWRILEVGTANDLDPDPSKPFGSVTAAALERIEKGVIGPDTLARLEAEDMLAVKPATAAEVEMHRKLAAEAPGDKDAQIQALLAKNADLEARMMRLELAAGSKAAGKDAGKPEGAGKQ